MKAEKDLLAHFEVLLLEEVLALVVLMRVVMRDRGGTFSNVCVE